MTMPADSQILEANPSLVAIFLVIRTRSGPRLVFHHPQHPSIAIPKTVTSPPNSPPTPIKAEREPINNLSAFSEDETITNPSEDDDFRRGSDGTLVHDADNPSGANSPRETRSVSASTTVVGGPLAALGSGSGSLKQGRRIQPQLPKATRTFRDEGPIDYENDDDVPELNINGPVQTTISGVTGEPDTRARATSNTIDPQGRDGDDKRSAAWDNLLGFSAEGLEKMLCPGREVKKKRFEVMIERLVFLGYPVFVRDDGYWRKKKNSSGGGGGTNSSVAAKRDSVKAEDDVDAKAGTNGHNVTEEPKGHANGIDIHQSANHTAHDAGNTAAAGSLDPNTGTAKSYISTGGMSDLSEARSTSASSDASSNEMTMFHVVFVMDPPPLEYHVRVDEMYDNVAKKFAKALKYEQASRGYVWKEAKKITSMRGQARETGASMRTLWPSIMQASPLARSLARVYDYISQGRIAQIVISNNVECSLQIPSRRETMYAPTPAAPQIPGLWLSTANMLDQDGGKGLSPYAALLLLQDKSALLKELQGEGLELAAPLAYFVRAISPSKSLQKLAGKLTLRVRDLQILARHLIYWRRARAIPPLHVRDTYTVSPYADMKALPTAAPAFELLFKGLPTLPRMLQTLSARPVPYGYLIPTQDHKGVYMDMLAWLLREAWVTQLRTFAWVRVMPEIKAKVAARRRLASLDLKKSAEGGGGRPKRPSGTSDVTALAATRLSISEELVRMDATRTSSTSSMLGVLSPLVEADSGRHGPDDSRSETSNSSQANLHSVMTSSQQSSGFFAGAWPSGNRSSGLSQEHRNSTPFSDGVAEDVESPGPELLAQYEPSLILAPYKATAEESQWLACIGEELKDREVRDAWPMLIKYFNGDTAIEEVASREGLKRSKVWSLFERLDKEGVLCVVRHW